MSRDDESPPAGRKPPPPPPPRTVLGQRISSRPPPPPEELGDSAPYTDLLAQLAAAEVEEFSDPEMQIRGKPVHVRVSWRAKRAAGSAFARWSQTAIDAIVRLAERGWLALRARAEALRERLRGGLPALRAWLWARRREIAVVGLSVLGLVVAADLARVYAPRALRAAASEARVVVGALVGSGAAVRAFAEGIGLAEARPGPPGKVPKPPPPRNRRFLYVTSTPPDATVTVAGVRFRTPIEIPITNPDEAIEVRIQKWGYAIATRTVEPDAFAIRDRAWRHTLDVVLERPAAARAPAKTAPTEAAEPEPAAPALPPDREALADRPAGGTQPLEDRTPAPAKSETGVPAAPF